MKHRRYNSLYERLVANTEEPENAQACWLWRRKKTRQWYGKLQMWVPGLQKHVTLYAHIAMFCCVEAGAMRADDLYLAILELRASGLEVDHLCTHPLCIFQDHLEAVTSKVNCARRGRRS